MRNVIFLLLAVFLANGLRAADLPPKTFQLDFSNGVIAECKGKAEPLRAGEANRFVDGLDGRQALYLPRNGGFLLYSLPENFPARRGTILLWLKPNWTPEGKAFWNWDGRKGIFCTAKDGECPGPGRGVFGNQLGAAQEGVLHYHWAGGSQRTTRWETRRVFPKGMWQCYAFSYDAEKNIRFFLNGKLMQSSRDGRNSLGDANSFYVGSGNIYGGPFGFDGALGRVEIYDGLLTEEEIRTLSYDHLPVGLQIELNDDTQLVAGREEVKKLQIGNVSSAPRRAELRFTVENAEGKVVAERSSAVSLAPGENTALELPVLLPDQGPAVLRGFSGEELVFYCDLYAIAGRPLRETMPLSKDGATKEVLLETIDCAADLPPEKYRDDGDTRVVHDSIGAWRETFGGKKLSGFIFKPAALRHPDRPHWLEFEYPDDRQRQFYVAVFHEKGNVTWCSDGNLNTVGVITGGHHPLSHTMRKKRLLFWPGGRELVVGCYTHQWYDGDAGAALSRISIYEIEEELPQLEINLPPDGGRSVGVWQEDPYMTMASYFNFTDGGNQTFGFWNEKFERFARYLLFTGQNVCDMPVFSYHGDAAANEGYKVGWEEVGARIMERENLGFFVSVQDMGICSHAAVNGVGGLARMIGEEKLCRTFEEAEAKGVSALERFKGNNTLSETKPLFPRLNPLHPEVQEGYLAIIRKYGAKYARYRSFRGFDFIVAGSSWSNLFFCDLSEGYGDWNIRQFEQDTKIKVPVAGDSPLRFARRFRWIRANAKEQWVQWRAEKLAEFYEKMARTLNEVAPGREIVVIPRLNDGDFRAGLPSKSLRRIWLERGVDFNRIAGIPNFKFPPPSIIPHRERTGNDTPSRRNGEFVNERFYAFSKELGEIQDAPSGGAAALVSHSNMETYVNYAPERVKSYFKQRAPNSSCHVSYSITHPDNDYELEFHNRLVADFDPVILLSGWWGNPDNGAIDVYQKFYRAFRSLPSIRTEKVPGMGDPVQARYGTAPDSGKGYLILVNREYYPVKVGLELGAGKVRDCVENCETALADGKLCRTLEPYQILCFESAGPMKVKPLFTETPEEIIRDLTVRTRYLRSVVNTLTPEQLRGTGLETIVARAEAALAAGEYAACRAQFYAAPAYRFLRKIGEKPVSVHAAVMEKTPQGFRLLVSLRNERPAAVGGSLTVGDGAPFEYQLKPFETKVFPVPVKGEFAPFETVELPLVVACGETSWSSALRLRTPILVKEGIRTQEFPLGPDGGHFSLSREKGELLVHVFSKDPLRIRKNRVWDGAGIELMIDRSPQTGLTDEDPWRYHSGCIQLGIPGYRSGTAAFECATGDFEGKEKVRAEVSDAEGGYGVLIRIPVETMLKADPAGRTIGFALGANRVDGYGRRISSPTAENEYWQNRSLFHPVSFE